MKSEYKIPGGKLLACELTITEGHISDIKLSGDFFMHPEAAIIDLESAVRGTTPSNYGEKIQGFFKGSDIILYGVSPQDFIQVIQLALDSE
jgi:anthranilate/para-aminobenzoate synthase component I